MARPPFGSQAPPGWRKKPVAILRSKNRVCIKHGDVHGRPVIAGPSGKFELTRCSPRSRHGTGHELARGRPDTEH